ncbi:hypothetical protein HOI83_02185, partial [Candidatus Uhrbacteria bacterium]|nr:hypothetical protein [Candidatus Uhrbacteria bacterium]
MQHLVDQLRHAGLSDREARVYLVSLSLGSASVQEIAHAAQIMRTTAYNVIDGLIERGLMKSIDAGGKRLLSAASPEKIVTMLKRQAEDLIGKIDVVESALPEFLAIENKKKDKPRVYFFEGKEGITQLSRRYEETAKDFFEIVPFDLLREFFDEHEFDSHKDKMVRNRISGKIMIVADKPPVESMKRVHQRYGWEVRYIEPGKIAMNGHISVKGDEIYGFAYEGIPIGVVIENPPLASAMRKVFEMAWESAPTDIA